MKVVFVGPSLSESALSQFRHRIDFRPPAEFGDIARAVLEGAGTIGLVDGLFEDRASVWHKEILFALSEGVHVFGAASMGALRAAECHRFGMVGVGEVFNRFVSGDLIDDDAVTQVHAPPELQYLPLSEPLVNIDATCSRLLVLALITASEAQGRFRRRASSFFLKNARSLCRSMGPSGSPMDDVENCIVCSDNIGVTSKPKTRKLFSVPCMKRRAIVRMRRRTGVLLKPMSGRGC